MADTHGHLTITRTVVVHPDQRVESPIKTRLSIIDAEVLRYSPTAAVWFYPKNEEYLNFDRLEASLRKTLSFYPHLCGQLDWDEKPFGRVAITYGTPSDPGAFLALSTSTKRLEELFPASISGTISRTWETEDVLPLYLHLPLALHNVYEEPKGLPSLFVQLTKFACGGFGISVKIPHALADLSTLSHFMRVWTFVNLHHPDTPELPQYLVPIFDPALVDKFAQLEISAEESRAFVDGLPLHRFDWFSTPKENVPFFMKQDTVPLPHLLPLKAKAAAPIPLETWNMTASDIETRTIFFSSTDLDKLYAKASHSNGSSSKVSRLDAVLAHVWRNIILSKKATVLQTSRVVNSPANDQFHLNLTVGMRKRLQPPLSDAFVGSPLIIGASSVSAQDDFDLAKLASILRTSTSKFDSNALQHMLHDISHWDSPLRFWTSLAGNQHNIVTSWLREGLYDIEFGPSIKPIYMEPGVFRGDGVMVINEAGPTDPASPHWHAHGVLLRISMPQEAMAHFLQHILVA